MHYKNIISTLVVSAFFKYLKMLKSTLYRLSSENKSKKAKLELLDHYKNKTSSPISDIIGESLENV